MGECQRDLRIFSVYFWHSDGWTPRNEAIIEAVLKRARTTKHPWLIACDAHISPEGSEKRLWFRNDRMNACNSTRRSVDVQIRKCQKRMGSEGA